MVRSPKLPPSLATPDNPNPLGKNCESWPRRNVPLGKSGVPPRPALSQKTHLPPAEPRLHGQRTPPGAA